MAQLSPYALAFLLSFCSLGYQQILALTLSDSTGDFVFSQALTLGIFLTGMGLGGLWSDRVRSTWTNLIFIEWILSLIGALSVFAIGLFEATASFVGWTPLLYILAGSVILMIGALTGFELPLLLRLAHRHRPGHLFCANYLGAFAATVLIPAVVVPAMDVTNTALALGLINFIVSCWLLIFDRTRFVVTLHAFFSLALLGVFLVGPILNQVHLRMIYFPAKISSSADFTGAVNLLRKLDLPLRVRSAYQWIDILPPEFSSLVQGRQDFQLYLDRKLQLSSGQWLRYHESLAEGAINLLRKTPERVLILGGGDGLLARVLLRHNDIRRIDLVEIDPRMIELGRNQFELRKLNGGSLSDARVHVHIGDAAQFVREEGPNYELILIDFPFPATYELSLLYTKEFYSWVRKRLAADGIIALDFPLPDSASDPLPHLISTLKAAGLAKLFAFGTEDFFIAASTDHELSFDYRTLFPRVDNQTLMNLISRQSTLEQMSSTPGKVNSVLFPIRFKDKAEAECEPSDAARRIRHGENPDFLPLFLHRFDEKWREFDDSWPVEVRQYWETAIEVPRDFTDDSWPRFQWGFEARSDRDIVTPIYQWFDRENPGDLRRAWTAAFHMTPALADWFGVTWAADLSFAEFHRWENGGIHVHRYEGGREVEVLRLHRDFQDINRWNVNAENLNGQIVWRQFAVGRIPPPVHSSALRPWQSRVRDEFLIHPRSYVKGPGWERIFYP